MYDCIIVGGGPAGMTASIYTARKKLKTLLIAKEAGGQMVWSSDVENYSGFSFITGADLTLKFEEHVKSIPEDLEVKYGEEVRELEKNITSFAVHTKVGETYYSRSIIIASGKNPKKLGIPGEDKFFGHGVATCATCDAPLYKGKTVAVVGGGNSAMDAILSLSKVAKQVHVVNINDDLSGDEILKEKIVSSSNVMIHKTTKALSIDGDKNVSSITIQKLGQEPATINVQGVFVEIGYEPSNSFDKLTEKNDLGEIIVDENLQTSVPGIFAAGDINNAWGEQIVIAAGEGAKAAIAVSDYLNKQK